MATNPTLSEIRAPYTIRARTSRPRSSVPNGCSAEGGWRTRSTSMRFGSCTDRIPGKAEMKKNRKTTAPPATASRLRNRRRRKSAEIGRASGTIPLLRPDSRVRQRVADVRKQVADQRKEGADHEDPHDEGVVPRHDPLVKELTHPGDREDRLEDDRPSEQVRHGKTHDGDHRQKRVPHRVAEHDRPLHQPLGLGGSDVVLPDDL